MEISKDLTNVNAKIVFTKLEIGRHYYAISKLFKKLIKQQHRFEQLKFKQSTKKKGE